MSGFSVARAFRRDQRTPAQINDSLMTNSFPLTQRGLGWMSRDTAHDYAELQKHRIREALQRELNGINYRIGELGIMDRKEIQRLRLSMAEMALERSRKAIKEIEAFKEATEYLGDRGKAAAPAAKAVVGVVAEKEGYVMKPATAIANDYIDEILAMTK